MKLQNRKDERAVADRVTGTAAGAEGELADGETATATGVRYDDDLKVAAVEEYEHRWNLSEAELAFRYEVPLPTLRAWVEEAELPLRPPQKPSVKEAVLADYARGELTQSELAAKHQVTRGKLRRWLDRAIRLRLHRTEEREEPRKLKPADLKVLVLASRLPLEEVGRQTGMSWARVKRIVDGWRGGDAISPEVLRLPQTKRMSAKARMAARIRALALRRAIRVGDDLPTPDGYWLALAAKNDFQREDGQ